tara:strand:- start:512 stop:769 length:258 start_codon:yes stop_codon:yes gene_type:complete
MIKLVDLLKEAEKQEYVPYMYSPVGFGCHVCRFYYKEDDLHKCSNPDYKAYKGTNELLDDEGRQIKDPTKWCSNWFKPADVETNK